MDSNIKMPNNSEFINSEPSNNIERYDPRPFYALLGRIGRARYLAYSFILNITLFITFLLMLVMIHLITELTGLAPNAKVISVLNVSIIFVLILTNFVLLRRRLHDLDHSGWIVFIFFIPYVNILLGLYVLFSEGNKGLNYFGYPAKPPTKWQKILAVIYGTFMFILHISWLVFYLKIY